ncbi:hypothetical protein, partial [Borreliella garinii]|uniref:hypothetical protein n=1 Tax=Borreliella garinii TaxID=29519 RepID=UPI001AEF59C9
PISQPEGPRCAHRFATQDQPKSTTRSIFRSGITASRSPVGRGQVVCREIIPLSRGRCSA